MNRKIIIGLILLTAILLPGCTAEERTVADYYSFKANTQYWYEGFGNEFAQYTEYTDFIAGNRAQLRINNGGTESIKIIEQKNGKVSKLYQEGEHYYRDDLTAGTYLVEEVLLIGPIKAGTKWTLPDGREREITGVDVDITVPLGKYKALEVTTPSQDSIIRDYYAVGVGLIKTVFIANGTEISSELSKIETDVPLQRNIIMYYPNIEDDKLYFLNMPLEFHTNDSTQAIIEAKYKLTPPGELGKVFSDNTRILQLSLQESGIVHLDLSEEFRTEMNAGSNYEGMILQSVVNTIGGYYGVNEVLLTVEGKPYTSGHFEMKEEETFSVNMDNSVEFTG